MHVAVVWVDVRVVAVQLWELGLKVRARRLIRGTAFNHHLRGISWICHFDHAASVLCGWLEAVHAPFSCKTSP